MTENIVNTPYHRQISLSKAGSVITQDQPNLSNIHLRLVRVNSIDRQTGLVSITGGNDNSVNGNRINKTVEHIRMPVKNYGINRDGNAFGTFPHIGVGDTVLLGYLSSNDATPIVIGVYPDLSLLPHLTPSKSNQVSTNLTNFDEYRAQKEVLPSQQVELKKGAGDYERTLNGNSFIAMLNPGNHSPVWRNDYYTGLPEDNSHGAPLEAAIDQSTGQPYQIQEDNAQDWVKIHQSNSDNDHHLTKRLVTQDGSVHNFIGNKLFKNDSITENASLDKGYELSHNSGSMDMTNSQSVDHLVKYAQKQIRNHLYGKFSTKDAPQWSSRKGYSLYNGSYIKNSDWGFKNEILYNPKHGSANGFYFIYSLLKECHYSLSNPTYDGCTGLYNDLDHQSIKDVKKGDISFQLSILPSQGPKESWGGSPVEFKYSKPALLIEDYKGGKTNCIAELKSAGNVKETTLENLYSLGPDPKTDSIKYLVFGRPIKPLTTSAKFKIHSNNAVSLTVTDPNIPNWSNQNVFKLGPNSSQWSCMNHKIDIDKTGISIDGKNFNDIIQNSNDKVSSLKSKNKALTDKFNDLLKILKKKKIVSQDFK